jgi:RimJ/RimL family protein N-acetyltransferase
VLCCTAVTDLTDGLITLRPPRPEDRDALVAVADERVRRFMGDGVADPRPTFAAVVDHAVVGWVDFDRDEREWLDHSQVNIGYALHADHRGNGYATRALMLLLHHLGQATDVETATLLIDPDNPWSLGMPRRAGFTDAGVLGDHGARFFTKPVPPSTYTDGVVTIRPFRASDFERDLEAKDEEQQRWLWLPEHREAWAKQTPEERIAGARQWIRTNETDARTGPKWSFVIDVADEYVGYVDCDLANDGLPHGEANVSYSSHPDERGKGYVSRGVRLMLQFLAEHTGARVASIGADERNEASLRVARAVGALEVGRHIDELGDPMVRYEVRISR